MTIKNTSIFPIRPNKKARIKNQDNGIILTHMVNLIDASKRTTADLIYDISDKNQYNEHFFYFRKDLGYDHYGYHYFFETYYNEIFGYLGCSLSNRSEYLSELASNEILNKQYQDWMLIVINGNLNYDIVEKYMYTKVAYQIAGIMNYDHLGMPKLRYLEDLIDKDKAKESHFLFEPMTHFDRSLFLKELVRFKDK